jgi:hypothetical protein
MFMSDGPRAQAAAILTRQGQRATASAQPCCAVMQSFICCWCDLSLVLVVVDCCVVVVVLLLLGYVERSDGGEGGGLVWAMTTPAAGALRPQTGQVKAR